MSWSFTLLNFLSFDRSLTRPIAPATSTMFLLLRGKNFSPGLNLCSNSLILYRQRIWCLRFFLRANLIDYGTALNLTKYLTKETEYIAWSRVSSSIAYVRDMLSSNTELFPKFQVRSLLLLSQYIIVSSLLSLCLYMTWSLCFFEIRSANNLRISRKHTTVSSWTIVQ